MLSCAMAPPRGMEQLASLLGVKVALDGFVKTLDEKVCSTETDVPGIYVCGAVEGPKDIPESVAQASAAASCAARAVMKVAQKPTPALLIDEEACGKCGLCVVSCPFEALSIDEEENKVVVDEATCRRCGLCATVCGPGAIELPNNERMQISQQIQSILKDGSGALHPLVLAFCCDECGYSVLDSVGFQRKRYPPGIIPIFIPCLSSLSIHHVIEALSLGADGVLILGCLEDRCHFEEGAIKARSKVEFIKLLLRELGLLENKANILMLSGNMTQDFVSKVNEIADRLRRVKT
ncbi:TPA: hydrogenase iron-sulfur subunit [Candidatus Bathyarchaeota archaeon]|nr:hydrogenase iron-sulfur subunit [Candidatus Bathyarchaeota archaeon]